MNIIHGFNIGLDVFGGIVKSVKRTLTLSIALLTLLVLGGCSNEYSKEQLVERGGLIYEVNSQIPFTGSNEWFYEDGQLQRKRNYKDGKEDGLYESYHENGQLEFKGNYKDGERDGLREWYYEDGQLQRKRNYKDGKKDGLYESYHENGQLKSKRNYKDGKEEGLSENYDENGKAIPLNSE